MSKKRNPYRSIKYYRGSKSPGLAILALVIMIFGGIINGLASLAGKSPKKRDNLGKGGLAAGILMLVAFCACRDVISKMGKDTYRNSDNATLSQAATPPPETESNKFKPGDKVLFYWSNASVTGEWCPATIIKKSGSGRYSISYGSGNEYDEDEKRLYPDVIKEGSKIKAFRHKYNAFFLAKLVKREGDVFIVKFSDGEVSSVSRMLTQIPLDLVYPLMKDQSN